MGETALVLSGSGCTMSDPTESTFSAGFRNDLGFDAKLGMCSGYSCNVGTEFKDTIRVRREVVR